MSDDFRDDPSGAPPDASRLSRRTLEQLARASDWDTDRFVRSAASARRAWWVAGAGAAIGVLGLATAALAHWRPPAPPMAVVVDRSTGHTQVVSRVTESDVPSLAVLDQHNASQYVRARESYHPGLLQRDYDAVARMSTPVAFRDSGDRFTGDKPLHKVLGTSQEHRVTIVSVRPVRLAAPGTAAAAGRPAHGEMVVTFDREVRSAHNPGSTVTRHVATLLYEYRPSAMTRNIDRIENPFGWVVTAYRVDAELTSLPPASSVQTPPPKLQPASTTTAGS